ncbi:MAG: AMP-binding protein, partial [Acidobacteriota bacterium]
MTLLSAFDTLLYRYSGEEDLLVGSAIANRNRIEIEPLIGFFVNMMVLRSDLSGNPSFEQLLERVRKVTLEAYAHQDLPFEQLVEELQPNRDMSHTPLFQVALILQNTPMPALELPGLKLIPCESDSGTSKFDLTLLLNETAEGIDGLIEYSTDLFNADRISRMLDHFQILLSSIVENPTQRLSDLPLLTEAEHYQLLVEWNSTQTDYAASKCIHELFEESVAHTPAAIAVAYKEDQLTYQELNHRANQLAHYLRKLGVGPDILVGICMERSIEMVIAILGVLKAGGAYVPLDPTYPKERLKFILEDAQSPLLLTQQQLVESLSQNNVTLVCLDRDWDIIANKNGQNPTISMTPDNLAYVIYTSGSTGKPKGVAMAHRSLINLIFWQLENSTLSGRAKTLQFSSFSFDVSFQEMFSTWCSGGMLVLISEELRQDAQALQCFLADKSIDRLFLPFIALQHLAEVTYDSNSVTLTLSEIVTAGEQLQLTDSIRKFLNKIPGCILHNQYGPSESHVATFFTIDNLSNFNG